MRITFWIILLLILFLVLAGCTESSTQWEHQRQSIENCRADATTESERDACGDIGK